MSWGRKSTKNRQKSTKLGHFWDFCLLSTNFLLQDTIFIFLLHFLVVIICSGFPGDQILLKFAFKNRSKFSRRGTCLEQIFQINVWCGDLKRLPIFFVSYKQPNPQFYSFFFCDIFKSRSLHNRFP